MQAIAEELGLQAARDIVSQSVNTPCPRREHVEEAAAEALQRIQLDAQAINNLRDRRLHFDAGGVRRRVLEDVRVPHIVFRSVPRKRWHILLANYEVYFRREKGDVAVARVRAAGDALCRETEECIHSAGDSVVTRGRDPSNALELLRPLHSAADRTRQALLQNRVATAADAALTACEPRIRGCQRRLLSVAF